ncbi:helix-turn-helix transcriptional regulator [Epilithonimonas sp. JDS]|uniref:helix-turn-helix domain-containing protein n=1 Tax=Epilithonimonas sp. JDS TaxID=2902797 RepID=UPI001E59418A|nr:helix-turn-helix transcriptional regulator [Epilithonimonas sp. JDS]MCD9855720.1 helix-turn-helix transcriptional regulator [Epilithonimonas sp. JDS]
MIKYYIVFFLFSFMIQTKAQKYSPKQIDSLIRSTTALSDKKKSLEIGFEAYRQSEKINYSLGKLRALNSILYDYQYLGNDKKTIEYANRLRKEAKQEKDYYHESEALISLSYVYAYSSFYKRCDETLEEAKVVAANIKGDQYYEIMGEIYQCKSDLERLKKNLDQQLHYDRIALNTFSKIEKPKLRDYFLFAQYLNISISYVDVKKNDSAVYYAREALTYSKTADDPIRTINATFGMADIYFTIGKKDSAIHYYKKVLPLLVKTNSPSKLEIIYNNMATMYYQLNDTKNYVYYSKLASEITKNNRASKDLTVNQVSNDILANEKEEQKGQLFLIIAGFAVVILIIIFFTVKLFFRYKKVKELKRTTELNLIEEYEAKLLEKQEIRKIEKEQISSLHISDDKERELMKKLSSFEKKEQFLSPEISLSSMASTFNTNVNYLSKIIKKHRDHNFSSYINELRINYITNKLRSNPEYLNYKIAYLAEECGFTSYSSFVSIFKQQTGITPSKFIEYLNKED